MNAKNKIPYLNVLCFSHTAVVARLHLVKTTVQKPLFKGTS